MKMQQCEVGLFKLPGLILDKEEMTPEKIEELDAWLATDQAVGTRMTELLWSFRTEAQREWFILRWS